MKNYVKIRTLSPLTNLYFFVDTPKYLADQLFIKHKVRVNFKKGEFRRKGDKYVVVECTVRKKDTGRFIAALDELPNKMLLLGYDDYEAYCNEVMGVLNREGK